MARNISGLRRGGPGRPKGQPNKATVAVKETCRQIVEDPTYLKKLLVRARAGKCAPGVETMLWDRCYGKVKEHVKLEDFPKAFTLLLNGNGSHGSD